MTVLWAGGEDIDLHATAGSIPLTTTNYFRPSYCRCGLYCPNYGCTWQGFGIFNSSSFWFSARPSLVAGNDFTGAYDLITFNDSTGLPRLALNNGGSGSMASGFLTFQTIDASGNRTTLGTFTTAASFNMGTYQNPDKLDIAIVYGTSGSINCYINLTLVFSYTGNIATNSITALAGFELFNPGITASVWSEIMVATNDTRSFSLCTIPPLATGSVAQWTGTVASINEVTLNDADGIQTTTANAIEEFTVDTTTYTPTSGTYGLIAIVSSGRIMSNTANSVRFGVKISGTDYFNSPIAAPSSLTDVQTIFQTNPATSSNWAYANLTGLGIAVKAV
jgi:hypothetical protein